ncbi:homeobox meis protein [Rutstroemia sp. NJR-2017a BVV2]|nr:homeobox meis protein [Rutstroemia sp. NJR-2017a BVV2]
MQQITKEQESTLRNWVLHHPGRPQQGDLAFLAGELGLPEEFINYWCSTNSREFAPLPISDMDIDIGVAKLDSAVDIGIYHSSDLLLDLPTYHPSFEDGILDLDLTMPDATSWSPIDKRCEGFSSMLEISRESASGEMWNEHSSRQSVASSCFTDNSSSILTPSNYGSVCGSSRSSGMSYGSAFAWDRSSMLNSVEEHPHDLLEQPVSILGLSQDYQSPYEMNRSSKATIHQRSVSDSASQQFANTILHHRGSVDTTRPQSANSKPKPSVNLYMKKLPELPKKADKTQGKYCCTACHMPFSCKGDWKRHEGSQCEPQKLWYCMFQDAAVQIQYTWYCFLCNDSYRDRESISQHLATQHKIHLCVKKKLDERSFKRKDKLKDHLRKVHGLAEGCTEWEKWHQDVPRKRAWGCGFCGVWFINWNVACPLSSFFKDSEFLYIVEFFGMSACSDRLDHIAEHYEKQQLSISQWSFSNVIKGLLKQPKDEDFDVMTAWKNLTGLNDQHYVWSDKDALYLRSKLERQEGTPQKMAEEAKRLAQKSPKGAAPQMWRLPESPAVRLARDMLTQPLADASLSTKNSSGPLSQSFTKNFGRDDTDIPYYNAQGFL